MILFVLALTASPASAADRPLPRAVAHFIERRRACDHWRGEYSPDRTREAEIAAYQRATCRGSDRALDRLRRQYRHDPAVLAALDDFGKVETE